MSEQVATAGLDEGVGEGANGDGRRTDRISLTVIGFIQYVSPTIALVLAVAFFGEQFTLAHGICFALIWLGIAAIGVEAAWAGRRKRAAEAAPPVPAAVSSPNPSSAAMFTDAPPAER